MPQLLIIEDHPVVAQMMIDTLRDDYQVSWESDGLRGVSLAFERIPDIIITDILVPGQDGYAVCEQIKGDIRTNSHTYIDRICQSRKP